jgi:predicted adenine nucleotide alpha hydrolase (AANH) superfamily ATPase
LAKKWAKTMQKHLATKETLEPLKQSGIEITIYYKNPSFYL